MQRLEARALIQKPRRNSLSVFYAIRGGEYGTAITRNVSLQRFANHSRSFGFSYRKSLFKSIW